MRIAFSINQAIKHTIKPTNHFNCLLNARTFSTVNKTPIQTPIIPTATQTLKQSLTMTKLRVGLCQFLTVDNKSENLKAAEQSINQSIDQLNKQSSDDQTMKLIVLPEMFNCPYSNDKFTEYAEVLPSDESIKQSIKQSNSQSNSDSPSVQFLRDQAKKHNVFIVGGSIPELEPSTKQIFNTCLVVNNHGDVIAKHRKIHLFDIDIPNKIKFCESDILSAGNHVTTFEIPDNQLNNQPIKIGVGICYDIRFSEYALLLRDLGCKMLIYPGAFNMTTGPLHWELLARARAIDNQLYVAVCSPARAEPKDPKQYVAWGHSTIVDPWGKVIATTEHEPSTVIADVDFQNVETVRENIPISKQKRNDIYQIKQV